MVMKSRLDELARDLSLGERQDLLEKIRGPEDDSEGEYFVHVEMEDSEKQRLIHAEIQKLSVWKKFLLWLYRFISGRDREQIYVTMKLGDIKRSIRRTNPALTGFETRDLSMRFARHVFDLYSALYPLKTFYQFFAEFQPFRDQMVLHLVEKIHERHKKAIEEFVTMDEIEDIFGRDNGQDNLTQLLYRRFDEYIRAIPQSVFNRVELLVKPFFALKNIVLFNYKKLLHYFDYYLPETLDRKYPVFRSTSAMIVIDHLERLYYSLFYAVKGIPEEYSPDQDVLFIYSVANRGMSLKRDKDKIEAEKENIGSDCAALRNMFFALSAEISKFQAVVPILDIIKFFRRDPFYRLKFFLPNLQLRKVYTQSLRQLLRMELDEKIFRIKDRVIERKIRDLFDESEITPLEFYTQSQADAFIGMSLPYFSRVKSLTLISNYIRKVYRPVIQDILETVNDYLFSSSKRNQNRLVGISQTVEEVEDKIMYFDKSLSPDEDKGKTLHRLKYNINTDLTHQKLWKSFIYEIDRDVTALIEKGIEGFSNYKSLIDEFFGLQTETMQNSLKTIIQWRGRQFTIRQLMQLLETNIDDFLRLLTQVMEMEKGR
ncbi:MAG: hypothetical protein EHM28_01835 [Spirochaetaceae bacterium]|nr:MAG: hypothetical protein EHM28_01835 [Spirochaetaceae bacterium]